MQKKKRFKPKQDFKSFEIALRFQPNCSTALALAELKAVQLVKEGFQLERCLDAADFRRLLGEKENAKMERDDAKRVRNKALCERNDAKRERDYAWEKAAKIYTSMTVAAQEVLRRRRKADADLAECQRVLAQEWEQSRELHARPYRRAGNGAGAVAGPTAKCTAGYCRRFP